MYYNLLYNNAHFKSLTVESRRGCLASVENKEEVTVELQKEKKLLEKRAKLNPYISGKKILYSKKLFNNAQFYNSKKSNFTQRLIILKRIFCRSRRFGFI